LVIFTFSLAQRFEPGHVFPPFPTYFSFFAPHFRRRISPRGCGSRHGELLRKSPFSIVFQTSDQRKFVYLSREFFFHDYSGLVASFFPGFSTSPSFNFSSPPRESSRVFSCVTLLIGTPPFSPWCPAFESFVHFSVTSASHAFQTFLGNSLPSSNGTGISRRAPSRKRSLCFFFFPPDVPMPFYLADFP